MAGKLIDGVGYGTGSTGIVGLAVMLSGVVGSGTGSTGVVFLAGTVSGGVG